MYKPINGWTKKRILEVIKARPFDKPAVDAIGYCVYLTPNGNKCAVGLFIPDDHRAQKAAINATTGDLISIYSALYSYMPLESEAMQRFQEAHDDEASRNCNVRPFNGNAKAAMLDWVERNVDND